MITKRLICVTRSCFIYSSTSNKTETLGFLSICFCGCLLLTPWSEWEFGILSKTQLCSRTKRNHLVEKCSHPLYKKACLRVLYIKTVVWETRSQQNNPKTQKSWYLISHLGDEPTYLPLNSNKSWSQFIKVNFLRLARTETLWDQVRQERWRCRGWIRVCSLVLPKLISPTLWCRCHFIKVLKLQSPRTIFISLPAWKFSRMMQKLLAQLSWNVD